MRKAFLDFLAAEGLIPCERVARMQDILRTAPEPIGAIAFSYGMINGNDVDEILDEQRHDSRPFGEIAVDKGLLTPEQVNTLLYVQRIRAASEVAEALALAGVCSIDQLTPQLGRFLADVQGGVLNVN